MNDETTNVDDDQDQDEDKKKKKKPSIVGDDGVIRLSLEQREIPVVFTKPAKDPAEEDEEIVAVLRELSGTQRDKYLNNLGNRARTNKDGKVVGMKDFDGMQANLLTRCLYRVNTGNPDTAFKEGEVQAFPARIQSLLFDKAKELSGMDDDAEESAGND
jgi:hypothetical protein